MGWKLGGQTDCCDVNASISPYRSANRWRGAAHFRSYQDERKSTSKKTTAVLLRPQHADAHKFCRGGLPMQWQGGAAHSDSEGARRLLESSARRATPQPAPSLRNRQPPPSPSAPLGLAGGTFIHNSEVVETEGAIRRRHATALTSNVLAWYKTAWGNNKITLARRHYAYGHGM